MSAIERGSSTVHLTPWDLTHLSIEYIQFGLLFSKPSTPLNLLISSLEASFSQTLDHFYPLAGRLSTVHHDTVPPSLSVSIDCSNQGAGFIVASAKDVAISDVVVDCACVPQILKSFFPLNGAVNHDGHLLPLLAVQVTELADGIFIGCSLNHSVGDGTSFWHFLNSWSEMSRTGGSEISCPPVLERLFIDPCTPPICLPFESPREFVERFIPNANLRECFFAFSADNISKLKARANLEMETDRISSLQALLAHVWRAVVRARKLKPEEETCYVQVGGFRSRIEPPLPGTYFGNCICGFDTKVSAGDVMEQSLGWTALQLSKTVATMTDSFMKKWLCSWSKDPFVLHFDSFKPNDLVTINSPRFNVYGNDFGWGRPIAVRSGGADKVDGTVTVYAGPEKGSLELEICASAKALMGLLEDEEFMGTTSRKISQRAD